MLKFVSKFILDIMPSVVATVIGAYIVNHYIIAKPATQTPVAAVASAPAVQAAGVAPEIKPPVRAAAASTDTKPAPVQAPEHPVAQRERTVARSAAVAPDPAWQSREKHEREAAQLRETNELARAAIERLGVANRGNRAPETSTPQGEPPRVSIATVPAVQPLPPAITVSTPAVELSRAGRGNEAASLRIGTAPGVERNDPDRLIPPADIPSISRLSSLPADAAAAPISQHSSVADDMFAAAKSVFSAVLPQ